MKWSWQGRTRQDRDKILSQLSDMHWRRDYYARHGLRSVKTGLALRRRRLTGIESIYGGPDDAA